MLSITEKAAFFQILLLKSLLLFGAVTDYLQKQDRKQSHCSMYTKFKDFSTVCKEIKQTSKLIFGLDQAFSASQN